MARKKLEIIKDIKNAIDWDELDELKNEVILHLNSHKKDDMADFSTEIHGSLTKDVDDNLERLKQFRTITRTGANTLLDNNIDFLKAYTSTLGKKYVRSHSEGGLVEKFYVITSNDKETVKEIDNDRDYMSGIRSYLQNDLYNVKKMALAQRTIAEFTTTWRYDNSSLLKKEPVLFKRPNESGWARNIGGCLADDAYTGSAVWEGVLNRMTEPEVFAAWVYGIYYQVYKGREIIWLYGKNGEEGKSYVANAIAKGLFGKTAGTTNNNTTKSANQFTTSQWKDMLFITYPECNNKRFLMSELAKTISSGSVDAVNFEKKFKSAESGFLNTRMLVCSNYLPEIAKEGSLESRLVLIEIESFTGEKNPEIAKELIADLPQLLALGRDCYDRLCNNNYSFELKETTREVIHNIQETFFEEFDLVFHKYFDEDEGGQVPAQTIADIMKAEHFNTNQKANFKEYLARQRDCVYKRTSKVRYYTNIAMKGQAGIQPIGELK